VAKNHNFGQILTFLGAPVPTPFTVEGQISPGSVQRVAAGPLRGEKPQNRPLSKLNTGRLAMRAMLPVMKLCSRLFVIYC